ncbi:MAG: PatB family C-S lyase [Anaerolineae bacterium]|nr:PatB family C-S lyase [Anaerolineae bacterium]
MAFDFKTKIDRSCTPATKWQKYDEGVLPMWVADMDFQSPPGVIETLVDRIQHGVFGYEESPVELKDQIAAWFHRRYGWSIGTESIVFLPGVVPGFNWAVRKFLSEEDGLLVQSPVYPHILHSASVCGVQGHINPLHRTADGTYSIDFDDFENQLSQKTSMFLLCNPHNPVGRVFDREELERMADLCLKHNVLICSDEIHGDLVFSGHQHIPIGSLSSEVAAKSITLHAPSKTFNIAGLKCAFAVIPNRDLRQQFKASMGDLLGSANSLGYAASLAAYKLGEPWLAALLQHLEENRDYLMHYLKNNIPEIQLACPEGTYLAWLNCSDLHLPLSPHEFFLEHARVALNDGAAFGDDGEDYVRLNFGCPRTMLSDALERMRRALEQR